MREFSGTRCGGELGQVGEVEERGKGEGWEGPEGEGRRGTAY